MAELAQQGIFLVGRQVGLPARPVDQHIAWVRAASADDALTALKRALSSYGEVTLLGAEPVNFTMYLGFLESEQEALEEVTHDAGNHDPRVSMVIISEPSKGSAERGMRIPNTSSVVTVSFIVARR